LREGRGLANFARMSAPQAILDLVERFERQLDAYKSGSYNEAQLRQEFLNPFFKALGWDMDLYGLTADEIKIVEGASTAEER